MRVHSLRFKVQVICRVSGLIRFRVKESRVLDLGCRVYGVGFSVSGLRFRVGSTSCGFITAFP